MSVSHSPAPARSDVAASPGTGRHRPFRVHGRMVSLGALSWALGMAVYGIDPHTNPGLIVHGAGALLFQVGVLFLLRALWLTQALGEGRVARTVLRVEAALISVAMVSSTVDALQISDLTQPGWLALDASWPLSMLGMFLIGIRIAVAGRWTGPARFWPMVAESWAVVTVPTLVLFGDTAAHVVACVHMALGYGLLGVLVSRKHG